MEDKKILIVEDDQTTATLLDSTLKKAGYDVIVAHNGKLALDLISGMNPRVIVTDVMMPEMNGFEFYKRVKALGDTSNIPFIVLTGRNDIGETFKELDIDDFFGKPIDTERLLERVEVLATSGRKKSIEQMKAEVEASKKSVQKKFLIGGLIAAALILWFILWLVAPNWEDKKMGEPEYTYKEDVAEGLK